jgi:hypothetical protein
MMAVTRTNEVFNSDLVWDITEFRERKRAALFIKSFENSFCVFSGSVNQLYTNYTINFPESNPSKIIILPNQYKYHDTYNLVPEPAIVQTRIQLVRQGDHAEPMLRIPFRAGKKNYHTLPLSTGLNIVRRFFGREDPFLPVLVKGDLRELDIRTPYLQLHRICLPQLAKMSLFDRAGIMNAINKKLRFIK